MSEQELREMCELLRRIGFTVLTVDRETETLTIRPLQVRE